MKLKDESRLVIFDLDSTLFNVSHRTQSIIESYAKLPQYKKEFPQQIEQLKNVKVEFRDWGLTEPLRRAGVQNTPDFFRSLTNYWNEHFFSDNFLHMDVPYEGAAEYVTTLNNDGAHILYLTGRDEPHMKKGTLASLEKWGFPLTDPNQQLIMKPAKGALEDEVYKGMHIQTLKHLAPNVWFFENEPVIIRYVMTTSPEVRVVWVDTTHSGRENPPAGLPVVRERWGR